jgi:hypothetical protein
MLAFRNPVLLIFCLALLGAACKTGLPVDTSPPTVSITSPTDNQLIVIDSVVVEVAVSDNVGTDRVELYVDGKLIGVCSTPPWKFIWHVGDLALNSNHTIEARAYDIAGNVGISPVVSVVAQVSPPTVSITSPANNSVVVDSVVVVVSVSGNAGLDRVELYIDSKLGGTRSIPPWQFTWHVGNLAHNSVHTIEARAYSREGNFGTSQVLSVVVQERLWQACDVPAIGGLVTKILSGRNGIFFALVSGNVVRSLDAGNTWSAVTSAASFSSLIVDRGGNLYAGANGVFRSTDDGKSWTNQGGDGGGVSSLTLIANDWILTVSDGASCYRSTNMGQAWERAGGLPGYGEDVIYNQKTNTVYLKTFYHGANVNLWLSIDNGNTWSFVQNFSYGPGYPNFRMAVDSTGRVWVLDQNGTVFLNSSQVGQSSFGGAVELQVGPSGMLLLGGNGFHVSSDGGLTWVTSSAGLADAVVTAIGVQPGGFLFVGTSSGRIFRSTRPLTN